MKFSIIIPTYNEESDIESTIQRLINLNYPDKEIIVVDDSTDTTPQIVASYADRGVRLIRPEVRRGRCEARNIGIRAASGDVIVILNADVLLDPDYLNRIKQHYDAGYECVATLGSISNSENIYARYIDLHIRLNHQSGIYRKWAQDLGFFWTEGFSVLREKALQTELFPSGFAVPIEAGEDVRFVNQLRTLPCQGIFDDSIIVEHIAPSSLKEYWRIRKGRGAGTPQIRRFIDNWSNSRILLVALLKLFRRTLAIVTVFPMIWYVTKLTRYSSYNRMLETCRMSYCYIIERVAMTFGEFDSLRKIIESEQSSK